DHSWTRVRSRQELGREERGLPPLERDRPHAERHPDGGGGQEGLVDHGRRGRRARRLIALPLRLAARGALAVLLTAACAAPARAQIFEQVGVRAQGLGGAFVAVSDDATATWWNPAGLATGAYFNAVLEYDRARDPDQTRTDAVAVAFPSLGMSYYRFP